MIAAEVTTARAASIFVVLAASALVCAPSAATEPRDLQIENEEEDATSCWPLIELDTRSSNVARVDANVPGPILDTPTGTGGLDTSIIRRHIKRNIDKITYCYEKQLLAKPGLATTVNVSFLISPNGAVTSVDTGLDPTVASCIADVLSHIKFPMPTGGRAVRIRYPLILHPAGE